MSKPIPPCKGCSCYDNPNDQEWGCDDERSECDCECHITDESLSVAQRIAAHDAWKAQGPWTPACGGTEVPFTTRTGRRLLYCYQARTGNHAYLDCNTDLILSDEDAQMALGA